MSVMLEHSLASPCAASEEVTERALPRPPRTLDRAARLGKYHARLLLGILHASVLSLLPEGECEDDTVIAFLRTLPRPPRPAAYDLPPGEDFWRLVLLDAWRQCQSGLAPPVRSEEEALALLRQRIEKVLHPLPPGHQEILRQRLAGADVNEIAQCCGRSKRSVERVLQEFREANFPPGLNTFPTER
jgi:hypothetical protein